MKRYGAASWGLPVAGVLMAAGGGLVWLGVGSGGANVDVVAAAAGGALSLLGLSLVVLTAWVRVNRDAADMKLHKYGCPKCGYEPHVNDIEVGQAIPCPMCEQPIYEKPGKPASRLRRHWQRHQPAQPTTADAKAPGGPTSRQRLQFH